MIYPNGIPVATCVLLFRCGYAAEQSRKLTRRLLAASDPIRDNESLEEFAQHGEDRLGMTAQLRSWRDTPRPLDVA